ncbi:MAG: LCP family protein [Clostridia bacterium]|nr:LCP family protein [Clostridia bacterium]
MLSAFKNYAITFLIAAIIFSLVAFFVVQIVIESLGDSFFVSSNVGETVTTDPAITTAAPVSTEPPEPLNGESFNILLVGVDYAPTLFYNYDPDIIDALTPETEPETVPIQTTLPPETVAPPAPITVAEETTTADTGLLMPDGSLFFEGGFYAEDYRAVQADTIMLVRVDKERQAFTFTAFPPEMVLTIEGREVLLRDVFAEYGLDFLIRKINAMTGLPVDRYAVVNLEQFPAIVDALDGITYTVPCAMKYDDNKGNLHIDLKAGSQLLNGEQALDMLRFNGYSDGVNSRVRTAVSFVRAMMQKMTNVVYLPKAPELYEKVKDMVMTNFTAEDLTANLDLIFKYGEYALSELSFPGTYGLAENGTSIFTPNLDRALTYFGDYRRIYE